MEVVKVKTSIYVDRELWGKYKSSAAKRGLKLNRALEDLIREELVEELLNEALKGIDEAKSYEIDFEPVKPIGGLVSVFVRTMRDERLGSLP
ncbi:MAG: CopG family transcriptional regulator [Candidatus Bathyarchaeia archaeon]